MEISPTGSTFRMKTRFARFQNGQELLRMWSVFADVKTADDLDLPVPALVQRDDGSRAPSTVRCSRPSSWSTTSHPSPNVPRRSPPARCGPTRTTCS